MFLSRSCSSTVAQSQMLLLAMTFGMASSYVVYVQPQYESLDRGMLGMEKRGKHVMSGLNDLEDVCKVRILHNHQPMFGHIQNGSRVEIQQDDEGSLVATFVECAGEERPPCHGIDRKRYTSECVTKYDHRPAGVRLAGSTGEFVIGSIRIPISCQCQLRRLGTLFR